MTDPISVQRQAQQNAEDLQFFLRDLNQWENQMKAADKKLLDKQSGHQKSACGIEPTCNKRADQTGDSNKNSDDPQPRLKKKIPGAIDYEAWKNSILEMERKGVDKVEPDRKMDEPMEEQSGDVNSESSCEEKSEEEDDLEDEDAELLRCKQRAILEKDKGNQYYKAAKYDVAITCYSKGISYDPLNPLLPANRALALLKTEQFGAAVEDCNSAIKLDPTYVKAYQRRAIARKTLSMFSLAKDDLLKVLELEPNNKEAKSELLVIDELIKSRLKSAQITIERIKGQIYPVEKPIHLRSKNPLHAVTIQEITDEPVPVVFAPKDSKPTLKKVIIEEMSKEPMPIVIKHEKVITKPGPDDSGFANQATLVTVTTGELPVQIVENAEVGSQQECSGATKHSLIEEINVPEMEMPSKHSLIEEINVPEIPSKPNDQASKQTMGSTNSATSAVPPPPKSSYQFLADFRKVKEFPELLYGYVRQIPSETYPYIFQHSLDSEVLSNFISVYHTHYMWNDDDLYKPLYHLAETKRFSMLKLFFSEKDKMSLEELFQYMKKVNTKSEAELKALSLSYGCS